MVSSLGNVLNKLTGDHHSLQRQLCRFTTRGKQVWKILPPCGQLLLYPSYFLVKFIMERLAPAASREGFYGRITLRASVKELNGRSRETRSKRRCFHRVPCSTNHKRRCVVPSSFPFIQSVIRNSPKEQQWKSTLQVSNGNFFLPYWWKFPQ